MPDQLFDLSGKVALVTGTSRGLGQYFARALAKAGADLAITSRHKDSLSAFAEEIHVLGRQTFSTELDVRDHASIQNAITAVEDNFGKIDILVNNAGCNIRKPALDVTWDDWNTILETNLRGSFFVAQAAARGMVERGYGRIINGDQCLRIRRARALRCKSRRHQATHHEPCRRLGQARGYRQLSCSGMVQNSAESGSI